MLYQKVRQVFIHVKAMVVPCCCLCKNYGSTMYFHAVKVDADIFLETFNIRKYFHILRDEELISKVFWIIEMISRKITALKCMEAIALWCLQ